MELTTKQNRWAQNKTPPANQQTEHTETGSKQQQKKPEKYSSSTTAVA
jgi:hypothetical protein